MKTSIWIMNHYASTMAQDHGGRHLWFAKYLKKKGYDPIIFCANTIHNSTVTIDTQTNLFTEKVIDGIRFVFVKTVPYQENGLSRIQNMLVFAINLCKVAPNYRKPDIILASSVHPFTLIAGEKIAKKFKVKCICEIRDLWPESFVAYGLIKRNNPITKILYNIEKKIYIKADKIIMTWEGGSDYIKNQGWADKINSSKIAYIPNGVDLSEFDNNAKIYHINDKDLLNDNLVKIVYTGSIRKVNNLDMIVSAARLLQEKGKSNIKILVYGSGDELENLKSKADDYGLDNIMFKGKVNKREIPFILQKADINLLHNSSTALNIYGQSQNKLFEYLAAGRPVLQTYTTNYSIIDTYEAGLCTKEQTAKSICVAIEQLVHNEEQRIKMGLNAREAVQKFDFAALTDKLIKIIETV